MFRILTHLFKRFQDANEVRESVLKIKSKQLFFTFACFNIENIIL